MFRLKFNKENDLFEIHSKKKAYMGDIVSITRQAAEMGIDPNEILVALEEMYKNIHTIAEFGDLCTFMYTRKE